MILDSCPNLNDPEVAREFNEIKDATTEKTAYNIWSLNNGYSIDKAPNGAKSILFESLLTECNGDKAAAIRAKAALYGNRFREWFGDWLQEDKTNVSKVVDENDEPFVAYTGTTGDFEVFDSSFAKTASKGFFFTVDRDVASLYGSVKAVFLNIKNLKEENTELPSLDTENGKYDGISYFHKEAEAFAVWNPNQIKSAIGNIEIEKPGTGFSTTDDNIYHLETGYINTPDITNSDLFGFKLGEDHTIEEFANTFDLSNDFTWFPKLLDIIKQFGIKIRFENPQRTGIAVEFLGDTITLYIDLNNPAFVHTVIHEMLHAALHSILDADTNKLTEKQLLAKKQLLNLYDEFLKRKNRPFKYANITDIHEFVSELSNVDFRKYLKYDNILKYAFKRFIDAFKALFGIKHTSKDPCDFAIEQLLDGAVLTKDVKDISLNLSNREYENIMSLINSQFYNADNGYNISYFDGITVLWEKNKNGSYLVQVAESGTAESDKLEQFGKRYYLQNSNQDYDDAAIEAMSHMPIVKIKLDAQRENWIREQQKLNGGDRDELAREFDLKLMRENTLKVVDLIASEYSLSKNGDTYTATNERGKYMAMLVNSMQKRLSDPDFAPIEAEFLNCALLNTGDISTMILLMAKVYVQDFFDSDVIQEVIKIIDPKRNMHMEDLEAEITNLVLKAVLDPSSVECGKVKEINSKITNFIRKRFGKDEISPKAKLMLIETIAKNMSCYEDLARTNTEDLFHDVKWYEITGKELEVTPKDIINQIKKGIKIQIRSLKSVTNVDENKVLVLNLLLAQLEDVDLDNDPDDVLGVVSNFIALAQNEISKANADLRSMLDGKPIDIDDDRLYLIKTDVIGYYRSVINNYIIPFTRNATNPTLRPGGALYGIVRDVYHKCTNVQHLYDYVLSQHIEAVIDKFVDENLNIGDKDRFKINCKLWLHNKINNGDLGFFENWVKSAVSSHSPVVRMVDLFVREVDTEVRLKSMKRSLRLNLLYGRCEPSLAKVLPFNYLRNFCELDDDGQTTGNFLTAVNVGQFEKEKSAFIDKWVQERGVVIEDDGNLFFPDDETWKDFNDAYDDFLEGRQHRRYTAAYYKLERQFMSRQTIEYRRHIRSRIQMLYDKCYDKEIGAPNIWDLDRDDKQNLQELLRVQLNLANPYIIEYDSNGKISKITEKTGDALKMAQEIGAFNKAVAGNVRFAPNYDKYNAAKLAIIKKFGENSIEYKVFKLNFSTRQATPLYYDKLRLIFGPKSENTIKEIDEIDQKIRAIINATIIKRGRYMQDLSKMSDEGFAMLKQLEEQRYKILEKIETRSGKELTEEQKQELSNMHHYEHVTNLETGRLYIKELEDWYTSRGMRKEFLDKYFVVTNERVKPLSVFSYDVINQEYIDEETPIGMFSDVDIESDFVDPEYDPNDDLFMNIDKTRYHNPKYDEMVKDAKAKRFYDEMLKMMDEAWSMLPEINRHYKYMLPQRRGNISLLAARDIINTLTFRKGRQKNSIGTVIKNVATLTAIGAIGGLAFGSLLAILPSTWMVASTAIISSTGYGTIAGLVSGLLTRDKNIADKIFTVTENDIDFNETYSVRPDGSEVETIPIRFVKRLEDPSAVDTSLIHSISSFYEMALNYSLKEKLAPIVENIQFELSGGFSGQSMTDQAERIRTHKSAMIYGRRKTGVSRRSSNKMTQSEQKITKIVQYLLNTTHAKMLPWNGISMFKNTIDSTLSFMTNVMSGKFITISDVGSAIVDMGKEIVNGSAFSNIASARTKSFTGAAMQYNGLHMSVTETFDDTEKYSISRFIKRFYSMGPFTFIDYTFKGLFINSLYNTYRLVLNPSTGKEEFMNKQEAQFAYAGTVGRKAGLEAWKNAKTKLKDAYYLVPDLGLKLKAKYEHIVRPIVDGKPSLKLESRISSLAKEQTAVINGMLDSQDINKVSQNFIGASILLMRGWMVSQLIDYNKDGQDFSVFTSNTDEVAKLLNNKTLGSLQSKLFGSLDAFVIQSAPTELEGQYNFATGFIEKGWWTGWLKGVRNLLQLRHLARHSIYQLKALATIVITTVALGLATHPLYSWREYTESNYKETDPFNKERIASNFLYTGTVAAYSERFGQLGPLGFANSFLELVNSPTVASSYVKDLNTVIDANEDILVLLEAMWEDQDINQTKPMQTVNRGSFKHFNILTRDLLKASTELPEVNKLGITNIVKTLSPDAQQEKLKFYQGTVPFAGAQPWLKLPEKSGGQKTSDRPKKVINRF